MEQITLILQKKRSSLYPRNGELAVIGPDSEAHQHDIVEMLLYNLAEGETYWLSDMQFIEKRWGVAWNRQVESEFSETHTHTHTHQSQLADVPTVRLNIFDSTTSIPPTLELAHIYTRICKE